MAIFDSVFAHALEPRDMTYYADKLTDYQRKVFAYKRFPIDNQAEMMTILRMSKGMEALVEAYQSFSKTGCTCNI